MWAETDEAGNATTYVAWDLAEVATTVKNIDWSRREPAYYREGPAQRWQAGQLYADASEGVLDAPAIEREEFEGNDGWFYGTAVPHIRRNKGKYGMLIGAATLWAGYEVYDRNFRGKTTGRDDNRLESPDGQSVFVNAIEITGNGNTINQTVVVQQPQGSGTGSAPNNNSGSGGQGNNANGG